MRFVLEVNCDNAAFEGDPGHEVARILCETAKRVGDFDVVGRILPLRDSNGNTVGFAKFEDSDDNR